MKTRLITPLVSHRSWVRISFRPEFVLGLNFTTALYRSSVGSDDSQRIK